MQRFADFIVQRNKRFFLFLVQQKISKRDATRKTEFLHTLFDENEEQTSRKKYRAMFF